jgi:NADH dehydrogenase
LNTAVTQVTDRAVFVGGERIEARTVFWAAGNTGSPLSKTFEGCADHASHLRVKSDLSLEGNPEVFVVGDQAAISRPDGTPVPRVAQGAIQMGRLAGKNILRDLRGEAREDFTYANRGDLAVIGRYRAITQFPWFSIQGTLAWFLWLFVHILYLAGFRNRLSVLMQWGYAFVTWERGVRLILRGSGKRDVGSGSGGNE